MNSNLLEIRDYIVMSDSECECVPNEHLCDKHAALDAVNVVSNRMESLEDDLAAIKEAASALEKLERENAALREALRVLHALAVQRADDSEMDAALDVAFGLIYGERPSPSMCSPEREGASMCDPANDFHAELNAAPRGGEERKRQ